MSELQSTLDELRLLAKDHKLRKKSPRFYILVKKYIRNIEQVKRLETTTKRIEAENLALSLELWRFINGGI